MSQLFTALLLFLCAVLATALLLGARRRKHYSRTLESLPVGLCTLGDDARIRFWSGRMEDVSGVPARRACGSSLDALPAPWDTLLREALEESAGEVIKRPTEARGGGPGWVILHGNAAGAPVRAILAEDISSYQQSQDEVLHRERLASIGRLAAGVAHEIGNPVTGIACLAQNLADLDESEEVTHSAEEIRKQTQRISRIVDSLVQFSHSGGATNTVHCQACNLADCVDEAIHLLSLDREAHAELFRNDCDRELLVLADNHLLLQVFVNLLDNARSASPADDLVRIGAVVEDNTVSIHVDNAGPTIPPDVLARIFEPFFTTKEVGDGTGLGLPLVRGMLEDMGGDIALHSPGPPGVSARATLRLPQAEYAAELIGSGP